MSLGPVTTTIHRSGVGILNIPPLYYEELTSVFGNSADSVYGRTLS